MRRGQSSQSLIREEKRGIGMFPPHRAQYFALKVCEDTGRSVGTEHKSLHRASELHGRDMFGGIFAPPGEDDHIYIYPNV